MYNNSLYQTKYSLLSFMTLPLFVIECYDLHTSAANCVILSQNIGGVVVVPFPGRSSDVSKRILTFSRGSTISRGLANKKDKNKEPQYKPQVIRLEKTLPSNCCQVQPSEPRLDVGRVLDIAPSPSCSTTAFQEAVILFVYLPDLIKMNGNQPTIQGQTQLSKSRSTTISDIRIGPSTGNQRVTFFSLFLRLNQQFPHSLSQRGSCLEPIFLLLFVSFFFPQTATIVF